MNRRDFLKFASAAPFAGVAAEPCVATGVGEPCDYNVDVLVVGGGPAGVCAAKGFSWITRKKGNYEKT